MTENKRNAATPIQIKEAEKYLVGIIDLGLSIHEIRTAYIYAAFKQSNENVMKTARIVKASVRTVRKLKRYFEKIGLIEKSWIEY